MKEIVTKTNKNSNAMRKDKKFDSFVYAAWICFRRTIIIIITVIVIVVTSTQMCTRVLCTND